MASIKSVAVVSIRRNHDIRSSLSFSSVSFVSFSPVKIINFTFIYTKTC